MPNGWKPGDEDRRRSDAPNGIEPRVTRVEAQLESVVRDIGTLTSSVHELAKAVQHQGENIDTQIKQLSVAIVQAAGPKKVDWAVIVSSLGLILTIWAATLSPLYLRLHDTSSDLIKLDDRLTSHERLKLHPVGETRIDSLEKTIQIAITENEKDIKELDLKLQNESKLLSSIIDEKLKAVSDSFADVKKEGSPITRERLSVIESQIQNIRNEIKEINASRSHTTLP